MMWTHVGETASQASYHVRRACRTWVAKGLSRWGDATRREPVGNLQLCRLPDHLLGIGAGGWERADRCRSLDGSARGRGSRRVEIPGSTWCRTVRRDRREAYLPTQQPAPGPQARFSRPDEHPRRARGHQEPSGQGPEPLVGLIRPIRQRRSFDRFRDEGVRVRIDPLWCSYVDDPEESPPRVAFVIGRAVGTAVTRNRLRRRLRAILVDMSDPLRPGLYLVGARRAAVELTFDQLRTTLHSVVASAVR